jgi:hypothetical protein
LIGLVKKIRGSYELLLSTPHPELLYNNAFHKVKKKIKKHIIS